MRPQLVHDGVHVVHVKSILLVGGISLGQTLNQFIHGGLVVAGCGGEGVDGLLARGGVGVSCGNCDEVGDGIQQNELLHMLAQSYRI